MTLLATDLNKIKKIFNTKSWNTDEDDLFNDMCKAIELLDDDEKELFFFLTNKFLRIQDTDFFSKIDSALKKLVIPKDINKIVIIPLLKEQDFNRIKSSSMFVYNLKQQLRRIYKLELPIYTSNNYKNISQKIDEQTMLIIPDDFIGSGNYAKEFIEELHNLYNTAKITFITIASLKTGKDLIKSLNCEIYSCHHLTKGIEDDNSIDLDKKNKYYKILHKLSEKLDIELQYEKGLYNSEALISFLKVPNNTFGLYWCVSKKGKELKWPQIFQRF